MKKTFIILFNFILISCSLKNIQTIDVKKYSDVKIYNNSFNSLSSISVQDSILTIDTISIFSDLIVSSYVSHSILFLSPSKDTILSKGNKKITGFCNTGKEKYDIPPEEGYFDMEYPAKDNWYFVKTSDERYLRIFVKEFSQDSLILDIELLNDTILIFQ
ncbi:MAG: hypothetical protein WHT27_01110 [candidate division WOR-3 bacterium]